MKYWVCVLFFLSGLCALIYEVAWMRMLVLTIGVTAQATSCVLAVFLGGLALGAFIGGRLADRLKTRTLIAYGLVEIGVGLLSPIVSHLMWSTPQLFVSLLHTLPEGSFAVAAGRFAISGMLLLPPTILMGASLPLLTRYLFERHLSAPQFFSLLYGFNTLGGVVGTLAACYIGFTYFGLFTTILAAAATNIIVGLVACLLGRTALAIESTATETASETEQSLPEGGTTVEQTARARNWKFIALLCLLGGLTGFTSIGYEMLWTRMLRFSTTSTTYAFTAIVSMFLVGLALGSFLYNRWAKKHADLSTQEQLIKFAHFQYFTAIACSASFACLPLAFLLRQFIPQILSFLPGVLLDPAFLFLTTLIFMLLPATLIGISFPMIASICTALVKDVSTAVGNVYAANTVGCVLGAGLVGLLLIPTLGSFASFQVLVVGTAVTGAVAVWIANPPQKRKIVLIALPISLAMIFAIFMKDPLPSLLSGLKVLKYGEDIAGTVMVLKWPDHKQLIMNGEGYSSTIFRGRRYMRLMGHLPVLLNAKPEDALVICFGMGTTAGAVSLHPEIKNEDVVELSPLVLQSGTLFEDTNYKVLSNSKVHPHIADGRNFLLGCNKSYDVISLEPPPPTEAGIVNLYSKEFYELLKQHLKPGGVACQWMPMSCESATLWRGMLAAAAEVFPQVSLWESNNGETIMICSDTPIKLDLDKLKNRMSDPKIHESLADVGLGDPYALLSTFVCSGKSLRKCIGNAFAPTDDQPRIEFFMPYTDRKARNYDLEPFSTDVSELLSDPKSLDQAKLKTNRQAMTLMRQATQAQVDGKTEAADSTLKQAIQLVPDNAFFKYASTHKKEVLN